ncbi:histone H3.v1-like [Portunus trituberculatus]|uniref:histone H3.v1-like n=1 Tax=Portunus trituberculatus TaxID=210409 RepID=UPI001E1CD570|nr:histone H3.v1-like [Portunus trituberculatus]
MGKTKESPVAAQNTQQPTTGAEAEKTGDKPRNWKETQDDVPGEEEEEEEEEDEDDDDDDDDEEDDEEEDEEVDVLGSGSEGEATSPRAGKPNLPSDPQSLSGKQEDDGWVTKTKRRRKPSPNAFRWVIPKAERKTTPAIALRESPTITKLRREERTGKVREDVLSGVYIHEENRFVGNIKGYTGFGGYLSHPYPKESSAPQK